MCARCSVGSRIRDTRERREEKRNARVARQVIYLAFFAMSAKFKTACADYTGDCAGIEGSAAQRGATLTPYSLSPYARLDARASLSPWTRNFNFVAAHVLRIDPKIIPRFRSSVQFFLTMGFHPPSSLLLFFLFATKKNGFRCVYIIGFTIVDVHFAKMKVERP